MSEIRSEEGLTELRDLVAQTLEKNGALAKIKAELRASVFLALEEQESIENKTPFLNQPLRDFLSTSEGELVSCLVREFLEYFHLDYTLSVFDQETYHEKEYHYMGREKLCQDLKIRSDANGPLLADVLQLASQEDYRTGNRSYNEDDSASLEYAPNSISENMRLDLKSDKRHERSLVSGVETIKVTLQPKSKQNEDKSNDSGSSSNSSHETDKSNNIGQITESPILNQESKNDEGKKEESPVASTPIPNQGKSRITFDPDSLGAGEEEFQSYTSVNEDNGGDIKAKGRVSPPAASVSEEIEEEIPSAVDEPLSSNVSGGEDTTADATISNPTGVADYMEDLQSERKAEETVS
ncbi:centrosomal protein 43-like [Ischnura elegans]|uniref:centrosomal protein 43-like n=1 Tax=Ischnura elegans TaxID=197161 RepID=UPI001ED8B692|nr:centrosomal protein 43-like [Ischnura elegans]